MDTNFFFSRDSEAALGSQSATMGGSFWSRSRDSEAALGSQREKLWRDQVFGAKVRPWEACFGPEVDWEKLWRDQVFGVKMTETNGHKLLFF